MRDLQKFGKVWKDNPESKAGGFCECGPCQIETGDGCVWCKDLGLRCKSDGQCDKDSELMGKLKEMPKFFRHGFCSSEEEVFERYKFWKIADIILEPGQTLERAFGYCECSNPRGAFVYAHGNGTKAKNLRKKISKIAKEECGNCVKKPTVEFIKKTQEDQGG